MKLRNFWVTMRNSDTGGEQTFTVCAKSAREAREKAAMMTNWDWQIHSIAEV